MQDFISLCLSLPPSCFFAVKREMQAGSIGDKHTQIGTGLGGPLHSSYKRSSENYYSCGVGRYLFLRFPVACWVKGVREGSLEKPLA